MQQSTAIFTHRVLVDHLKAATVGSLAIIMMVGATPSSAIEPDSREEEFVRLFDGKTLEGWIGAKESYHVSDGTLICRKGGKGSLLTEQEYDNFILRFEFRLSPGANNGLAIRAPAEGDAAYEGLELQILDNTAEKYQTLKSYQYHGSVYGIAPAKRGFLKRVGQWNQQEVCCQGRRISVVLNDKMILDIDLDQFAPFGRTIDGRKHPGMQRERGHLGFLSHGDVVAFRNIRVKRLSAP